MQRREFTWVIILAALGFLYVRYFTHWFIKPPMLIRVTQRPSRHARGPIEPVYFILSGPYRLTSIEVIPITSEKFNPLDRPAWHMISESNSVPVRAFRYGQRIAGMKPAVAHIAPDPLTPGTPYRLLVSAGPVTGTADFRMKGP